MIGLNRFTAAGRATAPPSANPLLLRGVLFTTQFRSQPRIAWWELTLELDGEPEQNCYCSREEALDVARSLAFDYCGRIAGLWLIDPLGRAENLLNLPLMAEDYLDRCSKKPA